MNERRVAQPEAARRRWRTAVWSLVLMATLSMVLPLGGYLYVGMSDARAQSVEETNPRSNYWRAVRGGDAGYTAVPGQEAGVLIQPGQNWRQIRNGYIANYGGWFLLGIVVLIALFFAVRGTIKLDDGLSGRKIKRWSVIDRTVHWFTAILFVILAITGLSMLFGRAVLIPVMGPQGFAAWAELAMWLHNNLGPWFGGGVVLMVLLWIRHNLFNRADVKWFATGGGIVGKGHPDAGFLNGGEKMWFWFIATAGLAVVASGLVMNFPNWGWTRDEMQLANMIHGVLSLLWIGIWLGHAYIGTLGTQGALEGMTSGYVDANWAEQHHNLWYEKVKDADEVEPREDASAAKGSPA